MQSPPCIVTGSYLRPISPLSRTGVALFLLATLGVSGSTNAQPVIASYRTYGTGCAGSSGRVPKTVATSLPKIGSSTQIVLHNAGSQMPCVFLWGHSRANARFGSCTLYTSMQGIIPLSTSKIGTALLEFGVPNDPALVGLILRSQWGVQDPGANGIGWAATSGGELQVGDDEPPCDGSGPFDLEVGQFNTRTTCFEGETKNDCPKGTQALWNLCWIQAGKNIPHPCGGKCKKGKCVPEHISITPARSVTKFWVACKTKNGKDGGQWSISVKKGWISVEIFCECR